MGNQRMDLRIPDSTLLAIKKRAVAEGTSASEIARRALEAAFDNPGESGTGTGSGVESGTIRKVVEELLKPLMVRMEILVPEWKVVLADMDLPGMEGFPGSESGATIPPEIVRYLVETLGRLNYLSDKLLNHVSIPGVTEGELKDWLKILPPEAEEVLKKLKIGGDK